MTFLKITAAACLVLGLAACEDGQISELGPDKSVDKGIDQKHLSQLEAGIWVDPNGCDHWIIDDGIEGYLSQRLDRHGKPVCSGIAPPTHTVGDFKKGGTTVIGDPI